jgi:glucosamine kinase
MRALIADSGSTKCDWILVDGEGRVLRNFSTMGFNPYFHNAERIISELSVVAAVEEISSEVTHIFFYGAGSCSEAMCSIVREGLSRVFLGAEIVVDHDLEGAAYSTYAGEPAITCIIGTGSNSCYFDGTTVSEEVPALAYILGDEASGSYFGKKLLAARLYKKLPAVMAADFDAEFGLDKDDVLARVYRQPDANVFLAGFMPFIGKFKEEALVQAWLAEGFDAFIEVHVKCYEGWTERPIHFVGSIGHFFERELRMSLDRHGMRCGRIIRKPIDGLVAYHLEHVFPKIEGDV